MVAPPSSVPASFSDVDQKMWDDWNLTSRVDEFTPYMHSLLDAALKRVKQFVGRPRILEIGCGTGWMSAALSVYGSLCGIDLSPKAIEVASQACPAGVFHCGDFMEMDLGGPFDIVVTADTIAHVPDQAGFVNRVAGMMNPNGMLILMSQNAYALERSSWVDPSPAHFRHWPTLREIRALLAPNFAISEITTAGAGAATDGIYRIFNSRKVMTALGSVIGHARLPRLYEKLWLGNEWVVVARRR